MQFPGFGSLDQEEVDDLIGAADGGSVRGVESVLQHPHDPDSMTLGLSSAYFQS